MVVTTHLLLVETDVTLVAVVQDIMGVLVEHHHLTVEMVEEDRDILEDQGCIQSLVEQHIQVVERILTVMLQTLLSIQDKYHTVVGIVRIEEMVVTKEVVLR